MISIIIRFHGSHHSQSHRLKSNIGFQIIKNQLQHFFFYTVTCLRYYSFFFVNTIDLEAAYVF